MANRTGTKEERPPVSRIRKRGASCYVYERGAIGHRVYMAHPVGGDVEGNLERARAWYKFLIECNPDMAFSAQWMVEVTLWDDANPAQREAGLLRCMNDVERCDALILVGRKVSTGMARERDHAKAFKLQVIDWTGPDREWPPQ